MAIERVSVVADPSNVDALCNAFCSLMGPTRAERGCLRCELYTNWSDSNVVLLETLWKTREDLVQHLKSARYKSFLQLVEASTETPLIEFFFVSQINGLEIVKQVRDALA
jgi:quinol monooxygenase YgiN